MVICKFLFICGHAHSMPSLWPLFSGRAEYRGKAGPKSVTIWPSAEIVHRSWESPGESGDRTRGTKAAYPGGAGLLGPGFGSFSPLA